MLLSAHTQASKGCFQVKRRSNNDVKSVSTAHVTLSFLEQSALLLLYYYYYTTILSFTPNSLSELYQAIKYPPAEGC